METRGALQNIRGAVEGPSLTRLKSAQEVAAQVRISAGRLNELADAMIAPHIRIDGGEPLFMLATLKKYVSRHMASVCEGAPLPLYLRPIVLTPVRKEVPLSLAAIHERLCECPAVEVPPCIYFLIANEAVAYVGQTRNLAARLLQHSRDGKCWERVLFMPIPEAELLRVEAHWITALQPPLNRNRQDRAQLENVSVNNPIQSPPF